MMDVLAMVVQSKWKLGERTKETIVRVLSGNGHDGPETFYTRPGKFRAEPRSRGESGRCQRGLARFRQALVGAPGISIIAEIKRRSPIKGLLNDRLDVASLARSYIAGGARAISVVTEEAHFLGSLANLESVAPLGVPVMRKDFILGIDDLLMTSLSGADAVLLIAALHPEPVLRRLVEFAKLLGVDPVVEVHTEQELEKALRAGAEIVGINNRNLVDFSCDIRVGMSLARSAPQGTLLIGESGIRTREDVLRLEEAGFRGLLIGEALVTSPDPERKLKELLGSS